MKRYRKLFEGVQEIYNFIDLNLHKFIKKSKVTLYHATSQKNAGFIVSSNKITNSTDDIWGKGFWAGAKPFKEYGDFIIEIEIEGNILKLDEFYDLLENEGSSYYRWFVEEDRKTIIQLLKKHKIDVLFSESDYCFVDANSKYKIISAKNIK